jgi:hypothetical protein
MTPRRTTEAWPETMFVGKYEQPEDAHAASEIEDEPADDFGVFRGLVWAVAVVAACAFFALILCSRQQ